jgi:hypothetical protein
MNIKKIASTGFNANSITQNASIVPSIDTSNIGGKISKLKSVSKLPNLASGGNIVDAAKNKGMGLQALAAQTGLSNGVGGIGSLKSSIASSLPSAGGGLVGNLASGFAKSVKLPKLNVPSLPSIGGLV